MFLMKCNRLQTVCEQSATAFTWRARVQQFVNRVQPFVITTANGDGAQATKNPVVEHKGSVERFGVFFMASGARSAASAVGQNRSRVRQMFDARISVRNHPNSRPSAKISCPGVPLPLPY
jgi:hypothetical protein